MTISDESVEAAAKAFHGALNAPVSRPEDWSDQIRATLEAAAPFIRAEALEEAADALNPQGSYALQNIAKWLRARAAEMRQG